MKNLDAIIRANVRIIWQTGTADFADIKNVCAKYLPSSMWVNSFIDRMDFAYALSDVVVCRSGATTIAELTRLGKPAILIPYPHAADDHQTHNAQMLVEAGAAKLVRDSEAESQLFETLMSLLNDDTSLHGMSKANKNLGKPNAAHEIAQRLMKIS